MKILILGMGPTRDEIRDQLENGTHGYDELWGLPWSQDWARCDRLFEMHDWRVVEQVFNRPDDYKERLASVEGILYMQEHHSAFPRSFAYPLDTVQAGVFRGFPKGRDYFCSSISYALALALLLADDRIGVYGIDVQGQDAYWHQRPNLEWFLGFAAGRGIKVDIPERSALLKYEPDQKYADQRVFYPERYGYLPDNWKLVPEKVAI